MNLFFWLSTKFHAVCIVWQTIYEQYIKLNVKNEIAIENELKLYEYLQSYFLTSGVPVNKPFD